jgi:aminopeptidase
MKTLEAIMKKSLLKKFAKLVVKMGVNVRRGQEVIIYAGLDQPDFVEMVVEQAYKAGAKRVTVEWSHQPLTKFHVNYQKPETLAEILDWQLSKLKRNVDVLPAMIHILSQDPDGLKGVDQGKMREASIKQFPIIKPIREAMDNKYQWTIVAVPGLAWAQKVFPNLSKKKATNAMWEAILKATRVTDDPIKEWQSHNKTIQDRCAFLNSLELDYLHYTSSNGTDFKIWMIPEARWLGGGETTLKGIRYNPNMPTEEVFITPFKGKAEGKLVATMPLSYRGELIENFSVRFKDGKVCDLTAEKNLELLKQMVSMDEGASMIGECALVPYNSPIRESGILYYNTLFDENAACHFALGKAYTNSIINYDKYSKEDFNKMGVNDSMIHVDFMVGATDLNIVGYTRKGKKILIFKDGNWAF